jgi:hypothetical protein
MLTLLLSYLMKDFSQRSADLEEIGRIGRNVGEIRVLTERLLRIW